MVGTMPLCYYLLEVDSYIVGRGNSLPEAVISIGDYRFEVTDQGVILVNGKGRDTVSYNMEQFNKEDALNDWLRTRAASQLGLTVHKAVR
jgi:hypothetical protein